jgi:plastocyanin
MRSNRGFSAVGACVGVMVVVIAGCGSSGGGGGTGGASGTGGAGTGGTGGGAFQAVAPCNAEGDYSSGATTITFGPTAAYSPKCLKVAPGTAVTFSGDFTVHPLEPSALRGTVTGNPITATTTGASKAFTFSSQGFWAYFCSIHGASDSGAGMVGVVWVP